jgi:hypothetical protein
VNNRRTVREAAPAPPEEERTRSPSRRSMSPAVWVGEDSKSGAEGTNFQSSLGTTWFEVF